MNPHPSNISVLVIAPSRELAIQIHKEAVKLLTFHPFRAQVVFGGSNIKSEINRMKQERCDILVATPGRLIDHIENNNLAVRFANLQVVGTQEGKEGGSAAWVSLSCLPSLP
jgi:ATP-dependent RNA helicase MSS116